MHPAFDTPPFEHDPPGPVRASVLWLHGLGADGHDFEPIVPYLGLPEGVRFVFPNAPQRPVTVNGGMIMRAWYDLGISGSGFWQDPEHIRQSRILIEELIAGEIDRGVPANRIVIAGFSQGGAIALHTGLRYPKALAGILALSAPIPYVEELVAGIDPENRNTPVFMAHGTADSLIPLAYVESGRTRMQAAGVHLEWHTYAMGHEVSPTELSDIARWLRGALFAADENPAVRTPPAESGRSDA